MGAFRAAFANPDLRRIEVSFITFSTAEWATWIAVLVFAYEKGGSTAVGVAALIQLAPSAAVAPFIAFLGDRFRPERIISIAYFAQAAAMGATGTALLGGAPLSFVFALAAISAVTITLTRPLQAALFPRVTRSPAQLTAANAAAATITGASVLTGPALTGVLLEVGSPGTVFVASAAMLVCGGLLVGHLDVVSGEPARTTGLRSTLRGSFEGMRIIARDPHPRLVVSLLAAHSMAWGALDVLLVVLAIRVLDLGSSGVGYLSSAIGAGAILGAAASFALVGRRRLASSVRAGLLVWAISLSAIGAFVHPLVAAVLLVCGGAGRSLLDASGRILLQRVTFHGVLTRVFGVLEALHMGAVAVGSVIASVLLAMLSPRLVLLLVGGILTAFTLMSWRGLRHVDKSAVVPGPELDLVAGVPFLSVLPAAALERLAESLVRRKAARGEVIIRQGDSGDLFFMISRGEVTVAVDGKHLRTQKYGDYFGEIALLERVARTATVTARTDVELYALERNPFIEAVTGHPLSAKRADDVSAERLRFGLRRRSS